MKKYDYNDELLEKCIEELKNGKSISTLANEFEINRRTLANKLYSLGYKSKYSKSKINYTYNYEDDKYKNLADEYIDGKSLKYLSEKYNISTNAVKNCLKHHNVSIDNCRVRSRNIDFNINKFECIDSEEKAYWLGFLYADGYVNDKTYSIELQLQEKDFEHIVKFANFLELDEKAIRKKKNSVGDKEFISYRVSVRSKKMYTDLVSLGCVPRKSLILKYPRNIKKRLEKHFIRGYFDGDGSISFYKEKYRGFFACNISFLGTEDILDGIANFVHRKGKDIPLKKPKYVKRSNIFVIEYGGSFLVERVYNTFYKNSSIYLNRKKDKFIAVLKHNRRKF